MKALKIFCYLILTLTLIIFGVVAIDYGYSIWSAESSAIQFSNTIIYNFINGLFDWSRIIYTVSMFIVFINLLITILKNNDGFSY